MRLSDAPLWLCFGFVANYRSNAAEAVNIGYSIGPSRAHNLLSFLAIEPVSMAVNWQNYYSKKCELSPSIYY